MKFDVGDSVVLRKDLDKDEMYGGLPVTWRIAGDIGKVTEITAVGKSIVGDFEWYEINHDPLAMIVDEMIDVEATYNHMIVELKQKIRKLKEQVVKRDNDIIELEKTTEKDFLTKQEVKENYIAKDKVKEIIKELEKEKKICTKRTDIFVAAELDIQIESLKELLEEEE